MDGSSRVDVAALSMYSVCSHLDPPLGKNAESLSEVQESLLAPAPRPEKGTEAEARGPRSATMSRVHALLSSGR